MRIALARVMTALICLVTIQTVLAQDLSLQLSLRDDIRQRGEAFAVNFVVANPTTVEVSNYRVEFFASRNEQLDDEDVLLGEFRSVDGFIGNSFQENTVTLDTCLLTLGDWRIFGRVGDVEPKDPNPGNDIGLARETLSILRRDGGPETCPPGPAPPAFINPALNDAWFNAETPGQGFFVTVFGDTGRVFLAWFTFDLNPPDPGVSAVLGAPGQRWLTAFGTFEGSNAQLTISTTRGGRFDRADPAPATQTAGSIELSFDSCAAGRVTYEFTDSGLSGVLPIRRVAEDNISLCEALSGSAFAR